MFQSKKARHSLRCCCLSRTWCEQKPTESRRKGWANHHALGHARLSVVFQLAVDRTLAALGGGANRPTDCRRHPEQPAALCGGQENPLMYIDVYFRILHAYTIIYSIYLNIGFPIQEAAAPGPYVAGAEAGQSAQIKAEVGAQAQPASDVDSMDKLQPGCATKRNLPPTIDSDEEEMNTSSSASGSEAKEEKDVEESDAESDDDTQRPVEQLESEPLSEPAGQLELAAAAEAAAPTVGRERKAHVISPPREP